MLPLVLARRTTTQITVVTEESMDIEVITEVIEAEVEVGVGEMTVEIEHEKLIAITVEIEMIEAHLFEMNLVESDGFASHTTELEDHLRRKVELVHQLTDQETIEIRHRTLR